MEIGCKRTQALPHGLGLPAALLDSARRLMSRSAATPSDRPSPTERRGLSILGSTGSIGTQTLDVIRLFPDRFQVRALTAGSNVELLAEQAREFRPDCVAIGDEGRAGALRDALSGLDIDVRAGEPGLCEAASRADVDVVMAAVVGFAGLAPVVEALRAGKRVALANKETLVVAGALINTLLEDAEGTLLPVDSEHSAIFQCLAGEIGRASCRERVYCEV